MRPLCWIMAALLGQIVAPTLQAANIPLYYFTGSRLVEICESGVNGKASFCMGYIAGVVDSTLVCAPVGAELGQLRRVTTKYLQDHPERLHELAADLVADALAQAFPCG